MEMRGLARLAEEAGNANFTAIDEGLDASQFLNEDNSDLLQTLMQENPVILSEVYAFYDVFLGDKGTIRGYYEKYGNMFNMTEDVKIPEGYQDYFQYMQSTTDMA